MDRAQILQQLTNTGIAAVIRMESVEKLLATVNAIRAGGIDCIEITMTTPDALNVISQARQELPDDVLVGVGSVLDGATARMAINAGAQFVVSPIFKEEIIHTAHRYDAPAIPGGFTPTEVVAAWEAGADVVKVFPASSVGPKHLKAIKGPMPQIKLTPTGGVNLDTVADFLGAGAEFLGVGSALLNKKAIANEDWETLTELAGEFISRIKKFREGQSAG
ncbi:MAG: bifunctional 4-hydroxy-2-oxoglutarate aldolase/2-dehydro-3-deoxy-phosphogluconate aldolase [Candidatus Marinimicrobia bacterium]|nr:bifunctional 4-hydroxy-2-oxoglutarate aldolase/2-dehydro-3-deoxy-phosphogluconate aldolase [Candidatus Neomarinimicrobiota bacterium]MCF7827395.1 bifunctional 4-hydroxy-2-oxoglutarate aldolase/2-dehydro-3-deoxy-phosphogluconate aldolase [Candidatus Neomarinimicrobiota bacterium]MCF7881372.1 bifunctional 4-hydroxy-2-oxoglutarate aldolase/2-dehydro-3-deoxy-phosphogluconate aldolase [Candidatus Neomarinimicrobiota bacterium]